MSLHVSEHKAVIAHPQPWSNNVCKLILKLESLFTTFIILVFVFLFWLIASVLLADVVSNFFLVEV